MFRHIARVFLFFIFYYSSASGQNTVFRNVHDVSQRYNYTQTNVRKIINDKYGFLWVASQDGLSRFDGNSFYTFNNNSNPGTKLSGIDIWDIKEDTLHNTIFVLTSEGAIDIIDITLNRIIKSIPKPSDQNDNWFMAFEIIGNNVWFAGYNGVSVYDMSANKFINLDIGATVAGNTAGHLLTKSMYIDSKKNPWFFIKNFGLVIFEGRSRKVLKKIPISNFFSNGDLHDELIVNEFVEISDGKVALATDHGLRIVSYDKSYELLFDNQPCDYSELNRKPIYSLCRKDNLLYIATSQLYEYNLDSREYKILKDRFSTSNYDVLNNIYKLFLTKENLWLGGISGLFSIQIENELFRAFNKTNDGKVIFEHLWYVYPDQKDKLYVNSENGLIKIGPANSALLINNSASYNYQFQISDEEFIVSGNGKLNILKQDKIYDIEQFYPEFRPFRKIIINSHIVTGHSLVIMGTENFNGILIWNRILKNIYQIQSGSNPLSISSNVVNTIFKDDNKNIWVLADKSISVLNEKLNSVKSFSVLNPETKVPLGFFMDVCQIKDEFWISAYGTGLLCLNRDGSFKKIFNLKDGLSNIGVFKVFPIGDSAIYITTNNGLSVFNVNKKTFKNYYLADGLHSNSFEEACGIYKNGLIYAGGINGFTIIDPPKFKLNSTAPQIYISRIEVETSKDKIDTTNLYLNRFSISSDAIQTKLYFSGINWNNSVHTTFAWRIIERSKEWINIGNQNFITLIGQEHGTYHLQVKAANEDGVWCEPKELILIFEPKWYQTWWFYLAIALTISTILYALFRYRISQIKKQHEIRKNIATDLHDDLGSTLNSVKVFTNLAISGVKQEESLQQVKDNLTEATMSLRDMIWVLDDSLDTVDELITRLKQFAIPVAAASNIEATIKADSDVNSRQLTKEEKRNLFLICKEAINNSIKYSAATQIDVTISASGKKIQIVVADNGKGFNVDEVKKGYGLKNMQYRAGQIKFKVTLASIPNKGTQITLNPV